MLGVLSTAMEIGLPALVSFLYWRRCQTLAATDREPSAARQFSFAAGIFVWVLSTLTPLARLAEELVSAHMVQHLLLTDLAAVLIVLGINGAVLAPVLRALHPIRWVLAPLSVVVLWIAGFYVWHLPVLYEGALESPLMHGAEHGTFLVTGIGKWLLLLGRRRSPPLVSPPGSASPSSPTSRSPRSATPSCGRGRLSIRPTNRLRWIAVSPLTDQSIAGAIMTVEGVFFTLGLGAGCCFAGPRRTPPAKTSSTWPVSGVPLTDERARPAAAAGEVELLRSRIERQAGAALANHPGDWLVSSPTRRRP